MLNEKMTEGTHRSVYLEKQLSIGVVKYLDRKKGTRKVKLHEKNPAERPTVLSWEQRNSCLLPEDLKNFYLSSNGFDLTWSVYIDNGETPVGKMHIHPLYQVNKLNTSIASGNTSLVQPSLADLETESDDEEIGGREKPKFCGSNGIYELDDCSGYGKVCMYIKKKSDHTEGSEIEDNIQSSIMGTNESPAEVWFLDRSLRWHFLADSFLAYFRLMLMHLGLPQWQFAFTDIGLSLQAKQWFNMYAPIRLEVDLEGIYEMNSPRQQDKTINNETQLDVNRIFKGKTDKKKANNQTSTVPVKKKPVSSARSLSSLAGKSASSSSQSSIKTGRSVTYYVRRTR